MAPQGGLGWPQDSATAPHEELREAALRSCPKLISLDSNKIAPHFYLLLVFLGVRMVHTRPGKKHRRKKGGRGERKGKDDMR